MKQERDIENFVESVLFEVDAKAAAGRMDQVLSSINELRKVTSFDPKFDSKVKKLLGTAQKLAQELNKRL